jgi:hypothetical protein
MLNIAGILALIFGILFILLAVLLMVLALTWFVILIWSLIPAIVILIFGIMDFLVFMNCKAISGMVDRRQYVEAKSKTLIWMIIGFIFGGVLPGVLILVAYLKFDNLIRWGQPGQPQPQQPYYPPQQQPPPQQYPQQQPPPQQYPPQQPPPQP